MNWNKNYKKSDQISIKNCLTIDKINIKKNEKKSDDDNTMKEYNKIHSKTKNFGHNICFSEGRKGINNSQNMNINYQKILNTNKSSRIYNTISNNFGKDEPDEKAYFNTIYNTIYNNRSHRNRLNIKISNSKIKKINLKSTLNILPKKEIRINMSEKKQLMNHESNKFNQLFKYFEKKGKNSIKKIITERENKKNKYFNNIENNYIQFPYGSNNREEAKIKIKQIENDTVSINAQKLYNKNKYSKSRQNINKTYFSNELLVEKYDQKRLYNIISKIMEDKNKKIKK